jgi:hypothetical protein
MGSQSNRQADGANLFEMGAADTEGKTMNSYAGEVGGIRDWYPNSYRFNTEDEAKAFADQLKEDWIPRGFIWTTQTKKSKDPVNARWDDKKKDVIRLNVAEEVAAVTTVTATSDEDEDESPPDLVNERAYRSRIDNRRRKQRRRIIFNREAYRNYKDETRWYEKEQQALLSETIRDDLRHLISHGHCRYELSRRLYEAFKAAHGGVAPGSYVIRERVEHSSCRYAIDQQTRQIKDTYDGYGSYGDDGPHYAESEFLVTKSVKKVGVKTLKAKSLSKLIAFAEEIGIENAGMMSRPELIHAIVMQFENTEDDLHVFDLGEEVQGGSGMQELTWWLDTPEGRVLTGWYSYREWRGTKELATWRDLEETAPIETDDRKKRMARKAEAVERARRKLAVIRKLMAR